MKTIPLRVATFLCGLALCSNIHAQSLQLQGRTTFGVRGDGSIQPGDYAWLTATTGAGAGANLQRGMAYNPLNNHLYIPHRTDSSTLEGIHILDADTGVEVFPSLDISTLTNRGTFVLVKIDVADDGVIYAMNFGTFSPTATNTVPFGNTITTVYRWSTESTVPTAAFQGDPSNGATNLQWGYTFDVRGSGPATQILITSSSGSARHAAVLTTPDGTNFNSIFLTATNADPGSMGIFGGDAWGPGNTFWAKSINTNLQYFSFDTNTGTATLLKKYTQAEFPATIGPFGVSLPSNWLAGVDVSTPDKVVLFSIPNITNSPVFLSSTNVPTDNENRFSMGSVIFHTNRVFALDCNNGILALDIVLTTNPEPAYVSFNSAAQLVPAGTNVSLTAVTGGSPPLRIQWQFSHSGSNVDFVDIPGATNSSSVITNVQGVNEGLYHLVVSNELGAVTSADAQLFVFPASTGILTPLWSIAPGTRTNSLGLFFVTTDATGTPFQRSIAYNALSNQVLIISRTNANTLAGLSINVLDGTTGAYLYSLKTNGFSSGAAAGSISLLSIVVADDGAVYAANEVNTAAASGNQAFRLYRWADSGPDTTLDVVFSGQPAADATRWGDTMHVRGSGTNTQIILDAINNSGSASTFGAILVPSNGVMTTWISLSNGFSQAYSPGGSIGRSLQFGSTNTFWQKRKADRLALSSYDLGTQSSTELTNFSNFSFSTNLGPVGLDLSRHLLAGIEFATFQQPGNAVVLPDMLVVYEISDLSNPVLIGRFPFPATPPAKANNNWIGQIVFSGDRLYAVEGNNGVLAFQIPRPTLTITRSGSTSTLSWTAERGWLLESTSTLVPATWTTVTQTVVDGFFSTTDIASESSKYYRLRK